MLDEPNPAERRELVAEVERLRSIYAGNRSFDQYSRAFLETSKLWEPDTIEPEPSHERSSWELPLSIKLAVGKRISSEQPLDAQWLLSWWLAHPESKVRTPARRAFPEFKELFALNFIQSYPSGLQVSVPKRKLTHIYRAASATFEREFKNELKWCPDISALRKPLTVAAKIADDCMNELDAFSRYLGRNPDGRGTIEAHALLPDALAELTHNEELAELRIWADQQILENDGLVPVERVLAHLEGKPPDSVRRKSLASAADAFARISIGLAPDPRYAYKIPKIGEPVVLFRLPGDIKKLEATSPEYPGALLSIILGAFVAHADGAVSEGERTGLERHIQQFTHLSDLKKSRLSANLNWLIACPPSLGQLRKRKSSVNSTFGHLLNALP